MITGSYTIKIDQFEGPFDLLLFFIERDEIDIMDIPISKITDDFLQYIRTLEKLNLDVASEFILVAATLMRIKAKMLLPRPIYNDIGEEIDPREELSRKLIEYKKYKDIIEEMSLLEDDRKRIISRGNQKKELGLIAENVLIDSELESLTLFKLLNSFHSVLKKLESRNKSAKHIVFRYSYTIREQKEFILTIINATKKVGFNELFGELRDRIHAIVTFLSLLEMINDQEIKMVNSQKMNFFFVQST